MDYRLALMTGVDIPIPELQLVLHQPSITEISRVGEDDFFQVIHYLCLNKENLIEDENLLQTLTNFQILLKTVEQTQNNFKSALSSVLSLFFPNFSSVLTPRNLLLVDKTNNNTFSIDDQNFEAFQTVLRDVSCIGSMLQGDNVIYKPGSKAAQKIVDKIMKARKKVAAIKEKSKESLLSRYVSILTIGVSSMNLRDCANLTLFQLFDLVERYNLYVSQDIDLKIRLAGGDTKSEPENWMKNIHEKQ